MTEKGWEQTPAIGVPYLGFDSALDEGEIERRSRYMLARALNVGRVIAFVGSGTSRAYGYATWPQLSEKIISFTIKEFKSLESDLKFGAILEGLRNFLKDLDEEKPKKRKRNKVIDGQATASKSETKGTSRIDFNERILLNLEQCQLLFEECGDPNRLRQMIGDRFRRWEEKSKRGLSKRDPLQAIMIDLGIRRFVTLNYDREIEFAFNRILGCPRGPLGLPDDPNIPRSPSGLQSTLNPLARRARTLSFDSDKPHELVQFAIGAPGFELGVYHLHGVASDLKNLVLTERDYQRRYLLNAPSHRNYREALNLLFTANAVLFLGVGMSEDDLLRPLRQFVAERDRDRPERPLFALLDKKGEVEDREFRQFLYGRYGVKAIYYNPKSSNTKQFCSTIREVAKTRTRWWMQWRKKPVVRPPIFGCRTAKNAAQTECMIHHYIDVGASKGQSKSSNLEQPRRSRRKQLKIEQFRSPDIEKVRNQLRTQHSRLIFLLGRQGAGKGTIGIDLVMSDDKKTPNKWLPFDKAFFATMHFANDFQSSLDAASRFLLGGRTYSPEVECGALDRFESALESASAKNTLIVLGGVERLLVPYNPWEEHGDAGYIDPELRPHDLLGRASNDEAERFFQVLKGYANAHGPGPKIVLTGARKPIELFPDSSGSTAHEKNRVALIPLDRVSEAAVAAFSELPSGGATGTVAGSREEWRSLIQQLCDALRGHVYSLSILHRHFYPEENEKRNGDPLSWLTNLVAKLTASDLDRRPEIVVEAIMRGLEVTPLGILQSVALFTTPVDVSTIAEACRESLGASRSQKPSPKSNTKALADVGAKIVKLAERRLLLKIEAAPEINLKERYTAHTVLRRHVLHSLGELPETPGEPQSLALTGYCNASALNLPNNLQGYKLIRDSLDGLLQSIETNLVSRPNKGDSNDEAVASWYHHHRSQVRGAFGIVRSCWTATGIGRHMQALRIPSKDGNDDERQEEPHYETYLRDLIRIINTIRGTPEAGTWQNRRISRQFQRSNTSRNGLLPFESDNGVLYLDELAWLYNELGLTSYCIGNLDDAFALFRAAQDVNEVAEPNDRAFGYRRSQSHLHLALVEIDRARLPRARYHLRQVLRHGPEEFQSQARGYRGLLCHLSSEFHHADEYYRAAIGEMQEQRNLRGESIFLRHRSDLNRMLGSKEEAERDIAKSIGAAEAGRYPDLLHLARISEAYIRCSDDPRTSLSLLQPVWEFARRIRSPKIEADALRARAIVAIKQGDVDYAGRLALNSLGVSSANGMVLRFGTALNLIGKVYKARGELAAAAQIFRSVIELSERQGSQLQREAAERELMMS